VVGGLCGLWLGNAVVVFPPVLQISVSGIHPDWLAIVVGLLASAGTSFLGVLGAVRQAMRLPPAEAMRPEPPAEFRPSVLEHIGFKSCLASLPHGPAHLERKPCRRSSPHWGWPGHRHSDRPGAMRDGIDYLMDFQWRLAQRQDVTLSLIERPPTAPPWGPCAPCPGY
jgi:putative ABC transport system permease protein